jgi:hypothetical protein
MQYSYLTVECLIVHPLISCPVTACVCVCVCVFQVAAIEERNARYEAVVTSHRVADGGFISRPTQTINNPQKNQNDMAAPSALRDFGVQVIQPMIMHCTALCDVHSKSE